jgi:DNA-binding NarL/FixJ family response regulator
MSDIRVLVVDDYPLFAQGTAEVIDRLPGITAIGYSIDVEDALREVQSSAPDVVLCDVIFGNQAKALELLERIRASQHAPIAVLFLAEFGTDAITQVPRWDTAVGVAWKGATADELRDHLAAVVARRPLHTRSAVRPEFAWPTKRQRQIMALIGDGLSNREVGTRIGIGERTVEEHVRRLFERYQVHTRTELLLLAHRHGWLERHALS